MDDDIPASAKIEAIREGRSLDEIVSPSGTVERNGIPLFPVRRDAGAVTPEIIRELLEETE
ncbi:CopG family transcriptional regulator [Luteolibacter sp. Populi]|uniref:CopG family transcriptional regulator n=1 Tax=Luteolibacter sp. Populi TaxID=3230487 RepID=UPI003464ED6C